MLPLALCAWLTNHHVISGPSAAAPASDADTFYAIVQPAPPWATFGATALLASVFEEAEAFSHEAGVFLEQFHKFLARAFLIAVRHVARFFVLANTLGTFAVRIFDSFLVEIFYHCAAVSAAFTIA